MQLRHFDVNVPELQAVPQVQDNESEVVSVL